MRLKNAFFVVLVFKVNFLLTYNEFCFYFFIFFIVSYEKSFFNKI